MRLYQVVNESDIKYVRNPSVIERVVDDAVFLVGEDNNALYQIEGVSAALWRLLAEPCSKNDAEQTLKHAFPEITEQTIKSDVTKLFLELLAHNLIFTR